MPKVEIYSLRPGTLSSGTMYKVKNVFRGAIAGELSTDSSKLKPELVRLQFKEGSDEDVSIYDLEIEISSGYNKERSRRKEEIRENIAAVLQNMLPRGITFSVTVVLRESSIKKYTSQ